MYMELKPTITILTIRRYLRENGFTRKYSIKESDEQYPIEYLAYCIKQKRYRHNLPEYVIANAIEHNDKVVSEMKKKKTERKTILQQIIEAHEGELFLLEEMDLGKAVHTTYHIVVNFYKEKKALIREFQILSLVQTILVQYVSYYPNVMYKNVYDKLIGREH